MLILLGAIQGEASANAIDDEIAAATKAYEQAEAEAAKAEEKAKLTAAEAAAATKAAKVAKGSKNQTHTSESTPVVGQARYFIYLSSDKSEARAAFEQRRFARHDIQTTIMPVTIDQHVWYRLLASQHHNKAEALARLNSLKSTAWVKSAWMEVQRAK
ncbi:MAG: SPOR domain-containing protein [Mariprofundus sp.]|nr:SPOR domain-containing protein [Mariprofundus sp.]